MAATVGFPSTGANLDRYSWVSGNKKARVRSITLDNYVTGGWAISPSAFGLNSITFFEPANNLGYALNWDYTNNKLLAYSAPGTELANASAALSGQIVRAYVLGY